MLDSSRLAVAICAAVLGFLAVLAATQPPQASRELRRFELADLIEAEDARVRQLQGTVRELRDEIRSLQAETGTTGEEVRRIEDRIDELGAVAGTGGLSGPGVVVTLDDSTSARSPTGDPNDLVIHERDIQTVVNALWAAGAEAVAVDGERLSSASAVRCAGNTLLLHGTLRSPPYRVSGIGDADRLASRLGTAPGVARLRAAVQAFGLGYEVERATVTMSGAPAPPVGVAGARAA